MLSTTEKQAAGRQLLLAPPPAPGDPGVPQGSRQVLGVCKSHKPSEVSQQRASPSPGAGLAQPPAHLPGAQDVAPGPGAAGRAESARLQL